MVVNDAYDPKSADFSADVGKVTNKGADAIVVIGFNDDGGKVLKSMIAKNVGPKDVQIYTADGMQSSSLYKAVDPSNPAVIEGIKGTAPAAAPSGVTSPFTAKFAATGIDTIFSSYYYDCAILVGLAAQAAGSDDPAKIKDKMVEVSSGGTKCQTFKAVLRSAEGRHRHRLRRRVRAGRSHRLARAGQRCLRRVGVRREGRPRQRSRHAADQDQRLIGRGRVSRDDRDPGHRPGPRRVRACRGTTR